MRARTLLSFFTFLLGGTVILLVSFDSRLDHITDWFLQNLAAYATHQQPVTASSQPTTSTTRHQQVDTTSTTLSSLSMLTTKVRPITTTRNINQTNNKLAILRQAVQDKIWKLQNPSNCSAARKLLCKIVAGGCGFGCQLHHIEICFFMAIGSNRTMLLNIRLTSFPTIKSLTGAFLPLSKCEWLEEEYEAAKGISGNGKVETTRRYRIVKRFTKGPYHPYTPFAPNSYPENLKERLQPLISEPQIWWIGQVMSFLMRPQPNLTEGLEQLKLELGFSHPIVGVQIRRTDKLLREAEYHSLEEYMSLVERWFEHHENVTGSNVTRRVFLATDDVNVLQEARDKYPTIVFVSLTNNSYFAEKARRRSDEGFWAIVQDISLLTQCDHVICTFSSNIGRLVHELMIGASDDPPRFATSIDVEHYSWGELTMLREVTKNHEPQKPGELQLRVGDIIEDVVCRRTCNGTNNRTGESGFYPKENIRTLPLPAPYAGMQDLFT